MIVTLGGVMVWALSSFSSTSVQTVRRSDLSTKTGPRFMGRDPSTIPILKRLQEDQKRFTVFRTPSEGLPGLVRRVIAKPIYGMNWRLAQRLSKSTPVDIWAIPGNEYVCLLSLQKSSALGLTCDSTKGALTHGLATTLMSRRGIGNKSRQNQRLIVGIAPDRARDVVIHTHESELKLPVVHGVFMHSDDGSRAPSQITLIG